MMTYTFRIIWLDVVQQVFDDADKWSCSNSQTNKQENVISFEVLSWSSIWSLDENLWKTVTNRYVNTYK